MRRPALCTFFRRDGRSIAGDYSDRKECSGLEDETWGIRPGARKLKGDSIKTFPRLLRLPKYV